MVARRVIDPGKEDLALPLLLRATPSFVPNADEAGESTECRTTLTATFSPSAILVASRTTPNPPAPNSFPRIYPATANPSSSPTKALNAPNPPTDRLVEKADKKLAAGLQAEESHDIESEPFDILLGDSSIRGGTKPKDEEEESSVKGILGAEEEEPPEPMRRRSRGVRREGWWSSESRGNVGWDSMSIGEGRKSPCIYYIAEEGE